MDWWKRTEPVALSSILWKNIDWADVSNQWPPFLESSTLPSELRGLGKSISDITFIGALKNLAELEIEPAISGSNLETKRKGQFYIVL